MKKTSNALKSPAGQAWLSLGTVLAVFFILPRIGTLAVMIGCASIFTLHLVLSPELFKNRRGSLSTAIGLVTFLWLAVVVVGALSLSERGIRL